MRRDFALVLGVTILSTLAAHSADACRYTPLAWQQQVTDHVNPALKGQRKHTSWNRDQNRNFIDDEIEQRFKSGDHVNVVVDLNQCMGVSEIQELLEPFGRIKYIVRMISGAELLHVEVDRLPELAALPQVAMVEWLVPARPMLDASTRAVQSKESTTFAGNAAEDVGLRGGGVTIAIVDSGVNNIVHPTFASKFVAGFDAYDYNDSDGGGVDDNCEVDPNDDDCAPRDGSDDPDPTHPGSEFLLPDDHGTHVAGIALGAGSTGDCGPVPGDFTIKTCEGVAPAARLVDVLVCFTSSVTGEQNCADVVEALDWLAESVEVFDIDVVNMSLGQCNEDDGTSMRAQLTDYLAALGVVMVASYGNAETCDLEPGTRFSAAPGSASFAITVSASEDRNTVDRSDDQAWGGGLVGPRIDFESTSSIDALKPDLAAPGDDVVSAGLVPPSGYTQKSGTSMAAPHVAGAAAIILEAQPEMPPGSVKHLLKATADKQHNTPAFPNVDDDWDVALGSGLLNVFAALDATASGDVRFPNCAGPSGAPGNPCALADGNQFWNNQADINLFGPVQEGVENLIGAIIRNDGPATATFLVSFGVKEFGAGAEVFYHVGTQEVTLAPGTQQEVTQLWTPNDVDHQCIQVEIHYGLDSDFTNNVTQRNVWLAASTFEMQVETPFMTPARFEVEPVSDRESWLCEVSEKEFELQPFYRRPKRLTVDFHAPAEAQPGERATCDVAVYGVPEGSEERRLIGGVTVQTFVPEPCRLIGVLSGAEGEPVRGAEIGFVPRAPAAHAEPAYATTDEDGVFSLRLTPYLDHRLTVAQPALGQGEITIRPECGIGDLKLTLAEGKLEIAGPQPSSLR